MTLSKSFSLAWAWSISIIVVWVLVALELKQGIGTIQLSPDLVPFGVFLGSDLSLEGSWRLLASQWLHVQFKHMLFNALVIGIVGSALERKESALRMLFIGLAGGSIGQFFSALAYPEAFVSGASQAYLSLCGAAALCLPPRHYAWGVAAIATFIAVALDLFVSEHGAIKMGHVTAFIAGMVLQRIDLRLFR